MKTPGSSRRKRCSPFPFPQRMPLMIPEVIEITFKQGDPVAIDDKEMSPASLLKELNRLGGRHGIGRARHC